MASQVQVKIEEGASESDAVTESAPAAAKHLRWAEDVIDSAAKTTTVNVKKEAPKKVFTCSFCGQHQAAVLMKASWKGTRQPLCMLHYYTTAAVHAEPQHVKVLDAALVEDQLKGQQEGANKNSSSMQENLNVQDLFAEAFIQLKQDLAQASLTIAVEPAPKKKNPRKLENDPLSMLHDLGKSKKRRLAPPPPPPAASTDHSQGGGFIRPLTIPERLRKTQQQQAKLQLEQMARMDRMARSAQQKSSYTSKRKPTNKSIWNSVMDGKESIPVRDKNSKAGNKEAKHKVLNNTYQELDLQVEGVTCSCGSTDISDAGNVTSRNQCSKEEVWGGKDRIDEVILKYRCNKCGKNWQESG